ncbi:CoA transferase [Cereibacter sp. SYSU M97828]|nr:CoA transferase [Cereibacter flavus]
MLTKSSFEKDVTGPLAGLRVVDMSRLVCGNVLSMQLADFGADVIKVEPKNGDTLRAWRVAGVEIHWKAFARNKRSLSVDFRAEGAVDLFRDMLRDADVFIESFRPGVLEEMGLSPAELLSVNPRLIIVRISGWGQDGPYRERPGFGSLVEGMSGFAAITGSQDRPPSLPAAPLADAFAGLSGAMAVLVALRSVEAKRSLGQVIDLPLFDPLFSALGPQVAQHRLTGKPKARTGSRSTTISPRNVYETADKRWIVLTGSTQGMTERLFAAIGRPDLISDPRFSDNSKRLENWQVLDAIIAGYVATRSQQETLDLFVGCGVTVAPIYDSSQLADDPHLQERGVIVDVPDDDMGEFPMTNIVPRLSATPGTLRRPAPRLGEHSVEILEGLGIAADRIERLLTDGVVCQAGGANA